MPLFTVLLKLGEIMEKILKRTVKSINGSFKSTSDDLLLSGLCKTDYVDSLMRLFKLHDAQNCCKNMQKHIRNHCVQMMNYI